MIEVTVRMYTAKSSFLVYWGKASQQYGAFLIPRRNNSGFGKPDGRIYRRHGKAASVQRKHPKSPRKHTVETVFNRVLHGKLPKEQREGDVRDTPYA